MKKFLGRFFLLFMMILLIGGCARQKETENVMKKSDNQEKVMRYVNYSRFSEMCIRDRSRRLPVICWRG